MADEALDTWSEGNLSQYRAMSSINDFAWSLGTGRVLKYVNRIEEVWVRISQWVQILGIFQWILSYHDGKWFPQFQRFFKALHVFQYYKVSPFGKWALQHFLYIFKYCMYPLSYRKSYTHHPSLHHSGIYSLPDQCGLLLPTSLWMLLARDWVTCWEASSGTLWSSVFPFLIFISSARKSSTWGSMDG